MNLYDVLNRDDVNDEVKKIIRKEITKSNKIQKLLQDNESKYKTLIQTIPAVVYSLDKVGIITFVNDAIKQFGYSPTDLIGKHFTDIIHPDDVKKVSSMHVLKKLKGKITGDENSPKLFDERRTRERKTSNLEVRILSSHKGTKMGLMGITTHVDSSGVYDKKPEESEKEYLGTIGVIRDITDYRLILEKLEIKEKKIEYLENFLRVCANCHKVLIPKKDEKEQDSWIQMEVFISKKTSTVFSHGYCPNCYKIAQNDLRKHLRGLKK